MPHLTPRQEIEQRTAAAVREAAGVEADPLVTPSANPEFGDYQSNVAMSLAGRMSKERGGKVNPRRLAGEVAAKVDTTALLAAPPTVAGPGFINFALSPQYVAARCTAVLSDGRLGVPVADPQQRVVVEYSSPNIAKQMHVGHLRTTILGDCAARVLGLMHGEQNIIRQNHLGDWGTQFGMLIAWLRRAAEPGTKSAGVQKLWDVERADGVGFYEQKEFVAGVHIADLEIFYREAKREFDENPEFREEARRTVVRLQAGEQLELLAWRFIVDETRRHYEPIYSTLGVRLTRDDERGESAYNDRLPSLVDDLLSADVAERSEGAVVSFAGGFKSPLMIRKSDGGFGYGTTDLAAAEYRAKTLEADRVIYFVDARQGQHFKQVIATYKQAVKEAGWPDADFEHASFGSVLGEDGTPIKTRSGESVKLAELLDEAVQRAGPVVEAHSPDLPETEKAEVARAVGIGAVKYADLSKDRTSDYVFSFDAMLAFNGNTAVYLMYAHARARSILRKADGEAADAVSVLEQPQELALAKQLLAFPDAVSAVGRELRPHLLCTYLYELAGKLGGFYENCPVLKSEGETRSSRLALTRLTAETLAKGLDLLGIGHPDRM